ncbi:MAG: hypothetical protein AAGA85_07750 [Bacteroidota bacterium]
MNKLKLDDIKDKKPPFKVPDGYFEELEQSILAKTIDATPVEGPTGSIGPSIPRWAWAVAASVIIGVSALLLTMRSGDFNEQDLLAGISDEEIIVYLANYDLDEYEIVGDLSTEQFDELFADDTVLDGLDMEDGDLQDLMLEYEALDETLEI